MTRTLLISEDFVPFPGVYADCVRPSVTVLSAENIFSLLCFVTVLLAGTITITILQMGKSRLREVH